MNGDQKCLHNLYFDVNRLKLPLSYAEGVLLQYRTLETVSSVIGGRHTNLIKNGKLKYGSLFRFTFLL